MEKVKYNFGNITKLLEKLFKVDTEKSILSISLEDLQKINDITSSEITIILDLKKAIRNKKLIAFLSRNEEEKANE